MSIKRTIAKGKIVLRKREQAALAKKEHKLALRENKLRKEQAVKERKAKLNKANAQKIADRNAKIAKAKKTAAKTFKSFKKWYNRK